MEKQRWSFWKQLTEECLNDKNKYREFQQTFGYRRGFVVVRFPDSSIYLGYAYSHDIVFSKPINLFESSSLYKKYSDIMTSFNMYNKILRAMWIEIRPDLNKIPIKDLEFVEICLCNKNGQIFHYNGVGYKYNKAVKQFSGREAFIYRIDNELDFIPDWLMYYFEKSNIHLGKDKIAYEI